jgi:IclR family acetate operon transcriptional repressor
LTVAYMGHGEDDLRQRARTAIEQLRDETGESAFFAVPDVQHFIIVESSDSRPLNIGLVVPADNSATGRCMLPFFPIERQIELLAGRRPSQALLDHFRLSRQRGFSVSDEVVIDGVRVEGATTIAAPVFDADGRPLGAMGITGPSERLTEARQADAGPFVSTAARALSRGAPGRAYD